MFDFLKTFPNVTMEQYMWKMTIPQIALAKYDTTHVVYLSKDIEEEQPDVVINSAEDLLNDLGYVALKKEE